MKNFLCILLLLVAFSTTAQEIIVLNPVTDEPIPSVSVYNRTKRISAITNLNGEVNIDKFDPIDVIYFQVLGFKKARVTKQKLLSQNNILFLSPESQNFDPIIISASKFKQRRQDIPQRIFSQSTEDILTANPQTSADLLQQSGQVFIQKSQQGGGSPLIRGFSTNRLLITVDGVRMNTAIFRSGNLQNIISIDPLSVERTEVILGPGGVVYGSDAIGGVMNFYTLKPRFSQDSTAISGRLLARYATANNENTAHASFNVGTKTFASATSISANFFDDLRQGSHGPDDYLRPRFAGREDGMDVIIDNDNPLIQRPTGYDQLNLLQKFSFKPNQRWEYNLGVIYSATGDVDRYDSLNRFRDNGNPRSAEWYYGPQTWLMLHTNVSHRGNGKLYDKAVFTQAYQQFEEGRNDRNFQSETLLETDERVNVFSTSADFERYNRENNILYYGVEFLHNRVNSIGKETNITDGTATAAPSRYPDGSSWRSLAGYAKYQWSLQDNMTLQAGLRYNHIWLDATFDNTFFNFPFETASINTGALTGGIGLSYLPSDHWELRANASTAFRAPNVDDVGKIFDPTPGTLIVPNPNLESEYSYNGEIGVKFKQSDAFTVDVSAYYTFLKDALVPRDFNLNGQEFIQYNGDLRRVQAIQNVEDSTIYGVEVAMNYDITSQLQLVAHYSWLQGEQHEDDGTTLPVRHVAPAFGDAHLVYKNGNLKLDAFTQFAAQFDFNDLAPEQQERPYLYALDGDGNPYAPRWYTLNLRSQYAINSNVTATAILENITDQRYRTYSSGVSAAGRNLILAVNYTF
ncbi:MAG: TonB-dependent receptor [Nonlabens sp.]|nr:TonB-dependent receptor [Nonlabens sp.]